MAKIITVANQKGGIGKTTTCVNLGIGLARQNKKVLLIDSDAQGSLTASLGWRDTDKLPVTLATVMNKILQDVPVTDNREGILKHGEGVYLLPGNIELSAVEMSLVTAMSRETILKQYIGAIKQEYDYIIIDTCPSLGMLTINALAAADSLIIPVTPKYLDVKGLELLLKTVAKINRQINSNLTIEGILITMADIRTNYSRDIITLLEDTYKEKIKIFNNIIPLSVRASEISVEGVSIYAYDPNGKVASAYEEFTREVMNSEEKN
jgi:chromosome partitioning protein